MKYLRSDYRGIVELLHNMPDVMAAMGMYQLPHWTTLQKFLQRFSRYRFDGILVQTVKLFCIGNKCIVAVDATGFSNEHASKYYARRTGMLWRSYTRSIVAVDAGTLCIAAQHANCSVGQNGENSLFMPLVNRASKSLCIDAVVADKAYDTEVNHEFVHQCIGARCLIPIKHCKTGTVNGHYRRKLVKRFNQRLYHRRSMVETVFSVMKRKFGSSVNSRLQPMQNKEAALLAIVYNVYRYVNTHTEALLEYVFYSAYNPRVPLNFWFKNFNQRSTWEISGVTFCHGALSSFGAERYE
jgi:hypothetical protein